MFKNTVETEEKLKLNFIGTGSAFHTERGNNSAFIKKESSLFLIDCGGTVFHRMQELDLFRGLKNIFIAITHPHPDHVGSLGDTIFYSYYILNCIPTIFFPDQEWMERLLTSIGVSSEMYKLNSSKRVDMEDQNLGKFQIEFHSASHVDTIPTYGFLMRVMEKTFYYSGDANSISMDILDGVKSGRIDQVYQDTCGLDYDGNAHLSLKKLCNMVQSEYRKKFYCMHLDEHITEEEIKEEGFEVAQNF